MQSEPQALDVPLKISSPKGEPIVDVEQKQRLVKLYMLTTVTCNGCEKTFTPNAPTGGRTIQEVEKIIYELHSVTCKAEGILCLNPIFTAPLMVVLFDESLTNGG